MKRMISVAALVAALVSGSALAADLPSRKGPPPVYVAPPPPLLWTGFYAGLNIGGGWGAGDGSVNPFFGGVGISNGNSGGVVGGGQIGYNYQIGSFVIGAETDFQGTSIGTQRNNVFLGGNGAGLSLPWYGTVRGRAGFLIMPAFLVYGTAGFAYGEVQGALTGISNTRTGWTAGGGVEYMFLPNWSAKVEYNYIDLDSGGQTGLFGFQGGTRHHPHVNVVRAGVNYHFNFGAPAPVLAKY